MGEGSYGSYHARAVMFLFYVMCMVSLSIEDASSGRKSTSDGVESGSEEFSNISVTCGSDSIEIMMPVELVKSMSSGAAVSPNYVMFRQDASEHCRAKLHADNTYRMTVHLNSKFLCGSTVTEEDYQTEYRNEIVLLDAEAGDIRNLYNLTCVYQNDERVILLPPSSSKLVFSDYDGENIRVDMNLYRDKSYSEDSFINTDTPEISVGHFLFVSIDLLSGEDRIGNLQHLHVISKSCFASYFASSDIKRMYHQFIVDGCADELDSTVSIQSNGKGWKSRWKFQMFKWVNTTAQRIYLFCEIGICDETKLVGSESCNMNKTKENCFGKSYRKRNRRELGSITKDDTTVGNMVSIGPIFPKDSVYLLDVPKGFPSGGASGETPDRAQDSEEPSEVVPAAVGVVLGVCVIVIAIAGYLMWKRNVIQRAERRERSKKEIKQGFAFAIKSSNDQNIFDTTPNQPEETCQQDGAETHESSNSTELNQEENDPSKESHSSRRSRSRDHRKERRRRSTSSLQDQKRTPNEDEHWRDDSKSRRSRSRERAPRRHSASGAVDESENERTIPRERHRSNSAIATERIETRHGSRSRHSHRNHRRRSSHRDERSSRVRSNREDSKRRRSTSRHKERSGHRNSARRSEESRRD